MSTKTVDRFPPAGKQARFELFDQQVTGLILSQEPAPTIADPTILRVELDDSVYRVERSDATIF